MDLQKLRRELTTALERHGVKADAVLKSLGSLKDAEQVSGRGVLLLCVAYVLLSSSSRLWRSRIVLGSQATGVMVLMNLVVCSRSFLYWCVCERDVHVCFSASLAPWGQCCIHDSLCSGKDCRTCSAL